MPLRRSAFTLIEILIVIGVLVAITTAVIVILNPAELIARARDARRLTETNALKQAITLAAPTDWDGPNYQNSCAGEATPRIFVSVPSDNGETPPAPPPGWTTYAQVTRENLRNVDGTGWVPLDFTPQGEVGVKLPISALPVDPVNTFASGHYYVYVCGSSGYEITESLQSSRYTQIAQEGGDDPTVFEIGTNLSIAPPRGALACSITPASAPVGAAVVAAGFGGDGTYVWSAPYGVPDAGTGQTFSIAYTIPGNATVTVQSAGVTAACSVVITLGADTQAPTVPANLAATAVSSSQINLSWTVSTDNVGVSGYRIYRGGFQIATTTTATTYQDAGLTASTTYAYTVAAYDAAGNASAQSASASATTQAAVSGGPAISGIATNVSQYPGSQVPKYEKFEATFDVATVSQNLQFPYDENPPAGIQSGTGITVNGVFTSDNWQTTYTVPAFYYQYFLDERRNNLPWYYPTGAYAWKIRFAPPQTGNWQYKVTARDSQGYTESSPMPFTVSQSANKGFVKVASDPRYFEFENGTYFPALSINSGLSTDNQAVNTLFQALDQNKIQLVRFWLSGWSIFGSSWNPWYEMRGTYGGYIPRTGLVTYSSAQEGQSMKLMLGYTDAGTQWYDSCRFVGAFGNYQAIKPNTNYQIRIRYDSRNIAGPRNAAFPNYGFVAKVGGWLGDNCDEGGSGTPITAYVQDSNGWQYLTGTWNPGNLNYIGAINYIYLVLENVQEGASTARPRVYIDTIELREDLGGGQYGPNIFTKSSPEHHLYFQQRNSYAFDKALDLAHQYDIYLKTVIMEKDDYALLLLNSAGDFGGTSDPNNFYGDFRTVTAGRWLQQAWWRYLQARWGYSTNIHSWELVNEGDPFNSRHYTLTDELGKYMHQFTPNKHLVTTSFWNSFPRTEFWANSNYPDVDFADVHRYIGPTDPVFNDSALATEQISMQYGALRPGGANKPVIRGETGFLDSGSGYPATTLFLNDTQGVWLKSFLWAGLNPGGLIESYWFVNEHIYNTQRGFDHRPLYKAFYNFVSGIPLNNGNYQNINATSSDSRILAYGQKDLVNQKAHVWIRNSAYTWRNIVDNVAITPVSATVSIGGLTPGAQYAVEWWDTAEPDAALQITGSENITANGAGELALPISQLAADTAAKISSAGGGADTQAPTVPTGLTAVATSSSQINLSWTASTDNVGVTGYRVYRSINLIATTTATTYQNTGLAASTTYTYTVSAYDAAGNASAQSASASATTQAASPGNAAPVASNSSWSTTVGTQITISLTYTDSDGPGPYTFTILQQPTQGTLTGTGGTRTYTPNAGYEGTDSFTWRVNDGVVNSNTATVSINITSQPTGSEDWPTAGANPQRTSASPANVATLRDVAWYRPIEAYISGSTQLITSGGRVYVATAKGLIVLDAENGNLVCRFDTELPVAAPTVDNGVVYLSGFDHKLYAINASTCATNWTFTGASAGYSANPLVADGRVYIGNRDGRFYAVNAANGSQVWSYQTSGPVMQSAAYDNGVVYVASMDMYGYAFNAATGSRIWRTAQKLPGDRYVIWWPVVHGNYVVWSAASAYKLSSDPGDANAPVPGLAYDGYFNTATMTYAGTFISSSDGSHGWPAGSAVMDTATGMTPYTFQSWMQAMPAGRVYAIINKNDGSEPFYLPWFMAGENGDGQMHPPASDGTSLYFNTLYQGFTLSIPRSTIFAWKEGTTWLRRVGQAAYAVDEPLIVSMANGQVFINLCCDREARRQYPTVQNFWDYSTMLDDILPSEGEPNSYDLMWRLYTSALERLNSYFKGNINSRNGVYAHHGMQNPLVPLAFTNGAGQRVERMFTHRGNAVIAIGPVATRTPLPAITINNNPPNTGATLTATQIAQRLETEVQKIIDPYLAQGTSGFLKPSYMQTHYRASQTAMPEDMVYYRLPADTVYTLSVAYPYLSSGLKVNVLSYLNDYWQKYFVTSRILRIGWNSGVPREPIVIPPEVITRMSQLGDLTSGTPVGAWQRTFYAAWKYAQLVPSQALSIYNAVRPTLDNPPSSPALDIQRNPAMYNDYIVGYQGFLNLYDLTGTNPDSALRASVASSLSSVLNTRLTNFDKDHPFVGLDNPTGVTINQYSRRFNCTRNFLYMTPDLGSAMRNSPQFSTINAAVNEYQYVCPNWFMTRDHNSFQEASSHHIFDSHAVFLAKAYVAQESQASLSKWIDVPWMLGDLYHMQNLVAVLEAP